MQRSEQIQDLTAALAKAQAEIEGATKDKKNDHFKSSYADLGAVWDAIRAPLTKHGLSVIQFPRACEMGVEVETTLLHTSGQYMSDTLALPVSKRDAHGFGSAITYARRYSLMAVAGIAPVDDDGNAAVGNGQAESRRGDGRHYDDIGKADAWKDWATAGKGSDCEKWLKGCKQLIGQATSVDTIDTWMKQAEAAKRIKALYEHHEERYDWIMNLINGKRDELNGVTAQAAE
jgi:hypothetical protein